MHEDWKRKEMAQISLPKDEQTGHELPSTPEVQFQSLTFRVKPTACLKRDFVRFHPCQSDGS